MVYSQLGRRTQCTVLKKSIQTVELQHSEARRHVFFLLQIFTVDLLWGFCFVIWNHTLWFFKFLLFSPRNTKWLKQRTFRIWKIPLFPQELWKTSPRIFSPSWSPTAPKRGTLTGFSKVGNKKKKFSRDWCLLFCVVFTTWWCLCFSAQPTASGSDIVKLYDLTTLCEEAEEEKYQNPFTLPVAVLLYKWVFSSPDRTVWVSKKKKKLNGVDK